MRWRGHQKTYKETEELAKKTKIETERQREIQSEREREKEQQQLCFKFSEISLAHFFHNPIKFFPLLLLLLLLMLLWCIQRFPSPALSGLCLKSLLDGRRKRREKEKEEKSYKSSAGLNSENFGRSFNFRDEFISARKKNSGSACSTCSIENFLHKRNWSKNGAGIFHLRPGWGGGG